MSNNFSTTSKVSNFSEIYTLIIFNQIYPMLMLNGTMAAQFPSMVDLPLASQEAFTSTSAIRIISISDK